MTGQVNLSQANEKSVHLTTHGLRVKPLVWVKPADKRGYIARSVVGQYAAFAEGDPRWAFSQRGGYTYFKVKTLKAAKAAANADYTARVCAALEVQP